MQDNKKKHASSGINDRRDFLKQSAAFAAAGAAWMAAGRTEAAPQAAEAIASAMPMVPFGNQQISRLVLGSNPVRGVIHTFPPQMQIPLREFYNTYHVIELLRRCEQVGIDYFQTEPTPNGPALVEALKQYKDQGGKLRFMATVTGSWKADPGPTEALFSASPASANIMGETVDGAYRKGGTAMEEIRDMLKKLKDRGFFSGISTHRPDVVEYCEEKGWETDFYTLCAYKRSRTREEWQKILGADLPQPMNETYLEGDPARACAVVQKVKKPVMLFKILAAGRFTRANMLEDAFKFALANIKPTDAIIVGMSTMVIDEPKQNAALTVKYSRPTA